MRARLRASRIKQEKKPPGDLKRCGCGSDTSPGTPHHAAPSNKTEPPHTVETTTGHGSAAAVAHNSSTRALIVRVGARPTGRRRGEGGGPRGDLWEER